MKSNWFVFFVQTGRENKVCEYLNQEKMFAFVPLVEDISKFARRLGREIKPMFRGYVLVESDLDGLSFIKATRELRRRNRYIIRLLGTEHPDHMTLEQEEKEFLLSFCDDEHVVRKSIGVIEGDKVIINSGPLVGEESKIIKIDRHKRKAIIKIPILGDIRNIDVPLEIITKI